MRYRDTESEQQRARDEVAVWRDEHPDSTVDEMLAALASRFHKDYGPFLRVALFKLDERAGSGTTPRSDGGGR